MVAANRNRAVVRSNPSPKHPKILTAADSFARATCGASLEGVARGKFMATRVLVADSSLALLNSYRKFLARDGFDVVTVSDGLECLAKLRTYVPDMVVIDLDLPWG